MDIADSFGGMTMELTTTSSLFSHLFSAQTIDAMNKIEGDIFNLNAIELENCFRFEQRSRKASSTSSSSSASSTSSKEEDELSRDERKQSRSRSPHHSNHRHHKLHRHRHHHHHHHHHRHGKKKHHHKRHRRHKREDNRRRSKRRKCRRLQSRSNSPTDASGRDLLASKRRLIRTPPPFPDELLLKIDPVTGESESISPHNDHNYCSRTTTTTTTSTKMKSLVVVVPPVTKKEVGPMTPPSPPSSPLLGLNLVAEENLKSDVDNASQDVNSLNMAVTVEETANAGAAAVKRAIDNDGEDLIELKNKFRMQLEHRLFDKSAINYGKLPDNELLVLGNK